MQQQRNKSLRAAMLALVAFTIPAVSGAAVVQPAPTTEQDAYEAFFAGSYSVSIPPEAIDEWGSAVLNFPVAGAPRGVAIDLDLSAVGAGDYTLELSSMYPIAAVTLEGIAREIDAAELAAMLAVPDDLQNVFCRRDDGTGGAVAWAEVDLVGADSSTSSVQVMISNDGMAHADQYQIASCAGPGVSEPTPTSLFGESSWLESSATDDEMVWCISWFSSMCFDKGRGMRRCDGEACDVTMAALLDLASAAGLQIPSWMGLNEAVEWLSRKLGLSIGGYCAKVYLLGLISVGCQCVLHTF